MPRWTSQELANYEQKRHAGNQGAGPHTSDQKLHVQHRKPTEPRVEAAVRQKFAVAITIKFADYRTRDHDAALSTILDCLIAARRFLERFARHPAAVEKSGTGR